MTSYHLSGSYTENHTYAYPRVSEFEYSNAGSIVMFNLTVWQDSMPHRWWLGFLQMKGTRKNV